MICKKMKSFIIVLALLFLPFSAFPAKAESEQGIRFEDPDLEKAVRKNLGKKEGPITPADAEKVEYLYVDGDVHISSLKGLEYFVNLRTLDIMNSDIDDLSPLEKISNLYDVSIPDSKIADIRPLANHKGLAILGLSNNQITDISALKGLQDLRTLVLQYNKITDVSALLDMPSLRYADLIGNPLDLRDGSANWNVIRTLQDQGVIILHDRLLEADVEVSEDTIKLTWKWNLPKNYQILGQGIEYGKDFYDIDIVKTNTATLKRIPGVNTILFNFVINTQIYGTGTKFPILIPATAGEPNVTAKPVVKDGVAAVKDEDVQRVARNGKITVDIGGAALLKFSREQVRSLKEKNVAVHVKSGAAAIELPAAYFEDAGDATVAIKKRKDLDGKVQALSGIYSFEIKQGGKEVAKFDKNRPAKLYFTVDQSKVKNPKNVKVLYYDEEKKKWTEREDLKTVYDPKTGVAVAETLRLSTYAVFEGTGETDKNAPAVPGGQGGGDKNGDRQGEPADKGGKRLPDTAAGDSNWLFAGILLTLSGICVHRIQKRRIHQQ